MTRGTTRIPRTLATRICKILIRPLETLGQEDCLDFQEQHSPTQLDIITEIQDSRLRPEHRVVRRRVLDAQLWRNLTPRQQLAAERIEMGFRITCAGLGSKGQTFSPLRGGKNTNSGDYILRCYAHWTIQCAAQRLPVNLALGILVEGRTLVSYAKERQCRKATISQLFTALLDAYSAANGI